MEHTVGQLLQDVSHALAHTEGVALDGMLRIQLGALKNLVQRQQHFPQIHFRRQPHRRTIRNEGLDGNGIAILARQGINIGGGFLEPFVFLQSTHQLGARIVFVRILRHRTRQQHPRLDLGQDRSHHQVFGRQFEAQVVHRLDVVDVLAGDLCHRYVENFQILPADQVQQQVQRAFKRVKDDFQSVRRNIQVLRNLQQRLPVHHRQRHFLLSRRHPARDFSIRRRVGQVVFNRAGRGCIGHAGPAPPGRGAAF